MGTVKCPKCGANVDYQETIGPWVLTYGDMVTNMLTFFIALLSFASFDVQKFNLVLSSFQDAIGVFDSGKTINLTAEELLNAGNTFEKLGKKMKIIRPKKDVAKALGWIEDKLGSAIRTKIEERGIVIQITNKVLFKPSSVDISPKARELISNIAFFLKEIVGDHQIRIEGYTDDVPLKGLSKQRFSDNLKLSTLRAIKVFHELEKKKVLPERMSATGYGPYRLLSKEDDETIAEWRARNRRVEIVVLRRDWTE